MLYDFRADWCGPCRSMDPIVQQLEREGFAIQTVDVDAQPEMKARYNIGNIPCFVLVDEGQVLGRIEGATSKSELIKLLNSHASREKPSQRASGGNGGRVNLPPASNKNTLHVEDAFAAVCRIHSEDGIGTGTAIAIAGADIVILTNAHVATADSVRVEFWRGGFSSPPYAGRTVWRSYSRDPKDGSPSPPRDMALVAVASSQLPVQPNVIPLGGRDDAPHVGQSIYSLGCAKGQWPSMFQGRVLRLGQQNLLEFTPPPAPGRSGSPLLSPDGSHVVGLIAWLDAEDENGRPLKEPYGTAMSINEILDALDGQAAPNATGEVKRASQYTPPLVEVTPESEVCDPFKKLRPQPKQQTPGPSTGAPKANSPADQGARKSLGGRSAPPAVVDGSGQCRCKHGSIKSKKNGNNSKPTWLAASSRARRGIKGTLAM